MFSKSSSIYHPRRDFGRQMARDRNGISNSAKPDRNTFNALYGNSMLVVVTVGKGKDKIMTVTLLNYYTPQQNNITCYLYMYSMRKCDSDAVMITYIAAILTTETILYFFSCNERSIYVSKHFFLFVHNVIEMYNSKDSNATSLSRHSPESNFIIIIYTNTDYN